MDKDLEELKKVFRALAVSSPVQVDVRSLLKDYRNMMGHMVPIHKWGYKDPLRFLKERCSDCFLISGPPANPFLTLIVTDSIKHIDQFVQKQKVTSAAKHKGKRRSVPESLLAPKPSLIADTFKVVKEETPVAYNNHTPNRKTTEQQDNKENSNHNKNVQEPKKEVERNIPKENGDLPSPERFKCVFQKRRSCHSSRQSVQSDITRNNDSKTPEKEDDDSGRQSASTTGSSSGSKMAKIDKLKREVMELISAHPKGVWCADLIRLYRERYKRELAFSQFGYISILSLVCELDVNVSRPQGADDWWLCHPGLVALVQPPAPGASAPRGRAPKPGSVDPEDALPGIQYDEDVFPADCIHFTESIPSVSVEGLSPGAMLEVVLGEVYSPSHFWFIRLGDAFSIAMDEIMDDMTQYYSQGAGKERHLGLGAVRVGQYCASVFDGDYHRSLIVKLVDSDTVKVRHVDYGTVDTQSVYRLKPLLRRWAALPAQATRARLAGLRPAAAQRRWPHAASAFFLDAVRNKKFVANVLAVDPEDNVVEVILIDTSTDEDVCVGTEIIRAGHADARADSALRTSEWYLYPRFEALEGGATPNYAEVHNYLRHGIALEYVDDYRRHVPDCLPAGSPPPVVDPAPPPPPAPASPAPLAVLNRVPLQSLAPPTSPPASAVPSFSPSPPNTDTAHDRAPSIHNIMHSPSGDMINGPLRGQSYPHDTSPKLMSTAPANFHCGQYSPRLDMPSPPMNFHHHPRYPGWVMEPVRPMSPMGPACHMPPRMEAWSPYACAPSAPGVSLSLADCEIYRVLSAANPQLAHTFMVDVLERGVADMRLRAGSQVRLNPHAPEFRAAAAAHTPPPPGFSQ